MADVSELRNPLSFALCWWGLLKVMLPLQQGGPNSMTTHGGAIIASIWDPSKRPPSHQNSLLEVHYGSSCSCAQFHFHNVLTIVITKSIGTNFLHANHHGRVYFLGLSSSNSWCQKWSLEADVECDFGDGSVSDWLAIRTWPQTIGAVLTAPGTW